MDSAIDNSIIVEDILKSFISSDVIPIIHEFGSNQTKEERRIMLSKLCSGEINTICISLTNILEDVGYEVNITPHNLQTFMITSSEYYSDKNYDEECHFSPDWRLTIHSGKDGTIYDFNGWPGDNECGVGFLKLLNEFTLVYSNGDQNICPESTFENMAELFNQFEKKRTSYYNNIISDDGS